VSKWTSLLVIAFFLPCGTWSEHQIAAACSAAPFQLRNAFVSPGAGVTSWPVLPGDKIAAGKAPVTVAFPDGSFVYLDANSKATLDLSGKAPVVNLQNSSAEFSLKSSSSLTILCDGKVVPIKDLTGELRIGSDGKVVVGDDHEKHDHFCDHNATKGCDCDDRDHHDHDHDHDKDDRHCRSVSPSR